MSISPPVEASRPRTYEVFISYRRAEASYSAGWLHDYFASRLGRERVFLDMDAIRPGLEFMSVIHAAIATAKVMLVLIGPRWTTRADGCLRLADPGDPVRIEVEAALSRDLLVIPLLLDGASMPTRAQLPPSMAHLVDLNAVPISRDTFRERLDYLLQVIADVLPEVTELTPPGDAPPRPLKAPSAFDVDWDAEQRSRMSVKLSRIYADYLRQALHDDRIIELPLRLRRRPEQVRRPTELLLPTGGRADDQVAEGSTLLALFDEAGGADGDGLLVLGEPGAGKSTALVALAAELLQRALDDPDQPVPVYLPLRHWGTHQQSISTWAVQELVELYGMPSALAQRWTSGRRLLFLLDGLDELSGPEARAACVAGINRFQRFGREYRLPVVVATRRFEYETLREQLELENAVEVLSFPSDLVERRLKEAGPRMSGVLEILRSYPGMRTMLSSPLLLSMITRTYDGGDSPAAGSVGRLFADYVEERFALERRNRSGAPSNAYRPAATRRWLCALADTMAKRQQSVFVLGRLTAEWLPGRVGRWSVIALPALLIGIAFLIPTGMFDSLPDALRSGLIVVLGAGLTVRMQPALASPTQRVWAWSRRAASANVVPSIAAALAVSLAFGLIDAAFDQDGTPGPFALDTARLLERTLGVGAALVVLGGVTFTAEPAGGRWTGRRPAFWWAVCVGLTIALGAAVARAVTSGPAEGGTVAVSWALLGGIGAWLVGTSGPAERVSWSWRRATRFAWSALAVAVGSGIVVFSGHGFLAGPRAGATAAVTLSTCLGVSTFLVAGFRRASVSVYLTPNEATWRSCRSGLLVGALAFVLLGVVAGGLAALLLPGPLDVALVLNVALAFGFQIALVFAMTFGLGMAAQHWLLRLMLWRAHIAPFRYGRWLNYAVSLKLLYRSGEGGYVFVHGLMQEHFALLAARPRGNGRTSS